MEQGVVDVVRGDDRGAGKRGAEILGGRRHGPDDDGRLRSPARPFPDRDRIRLDPGCVDEVLDGHPVGGGSCARQRQQQEGKEGSGDHRGSVG